MHGSMMGAPKHNGTPHGTPGPSKEAPMLFANSTPEYKVMA